MTGDGSGKGRREPHGGGGRRREIAPGTLYVLTVEGARRLDALATETYGIPSIILMENAARHASDVALDMLERFGEPRVVIVCGPGRNGGDGLAMARHLHNARVRVAVVVAGEPSSLAPDSAVQWGVVRKMGLDATADAGPAGVAACERAFTAEGGPHLIVDALFGTGLTRALAGVHAALVAWINARRSAGAQVLAVDVPSGMDGATGNAPGPAVRADVTVTFVGLKEGFTSLRAQEYLGEVVVADIGAPRELVESIGVPVSRPEPAARRPAPRAAGSTARGRRPGHRRRD